MLPKLFRSALVPVLTGLFLAVQSTPGLSADAEPLQLERKIPLGDVRGRIDHLAFDAARQRLFVAELGNGTIGVVNVTEGTLIHRIVGLREPQGVAYLKPADTVFVANAGDGTVHRYRGADYQPAGVVKLGDDADNIRIDARTQQVVIGYGRGGLAILAPDGSRQQDIRLAGHPESFQLDPSRPRIYANVPEAHEIAVIDRDLTRQGATWAVPHAQANFPMTMEDGGERLLVVYRDPAILAIFDTATGNALAQMAVCGDADDIWVDPKRRRIYISCGDGTLDVLQREAGSYRELARIPTVAGARTSLFVPDLDRLFLAVRASGSEGAAVWAFRPAD
jgi:DNA-binding beta-propeller fold protein YncE